MKLSEEDADLANMDKDKKLNVKEILNKKNLSAFELDLIMNDAQ